MIPERSFGQKIREVAAGDQGGAGPVQGEILAKYLNTVYFGRGAYGIQAAAQTFFQKDARS